MELNTGGRIGIAATDHEIAACGPVMRELRPHIPENEFLGRVRFQQEGGYSLAFLEDGKHVRTVAGFRTIENLVAGRVLYVDDFVTSSADRSKGYGEEMFAWLVERARSSGCANLELDSGVQRFGAHRFYLGRRMEISSHHFRLALR